MAAISAGKRSEVTGERLSMTPTVRRGPKYRLPRPAASGDCRESLDALLSRELRLSADQVRRLRWDWPKLIGQAIGLMRTHGHADAIASMTGPIDAAATEVTAANLHDARLMATELEGAANLAEQCYHMDPTPANRKLMLLAHQRELLAEQMRDNLERQEMADA